MQEKSKKYTDIAERISRIIEYLNISPNALAKKLGYERSQTLYDIINCKSAPSYDFFFRFLNSEYSEKIDIEWLIAGKKEMLRKQTETKSSMEIPKSALEMIRDLAAENALLKKKIEDLTESLGTYNNLAAEPEVKHFTHRK